MHGVKKFNRYLDGKQFILVTDHQPLVSMFNPKKGVSVIAAAQLQRWIIFFGIHCCIEFKGTEQQQENAYHLSSLPLEAASKDTEIEPDGVNMFYKALIKPLPVTTTVQHKTKSVPVTAEVHCMINRWNYAQKRFFAQKTRVKSIKTAYE